MENRIDDAAELIPDFNAEEAPVEETTQEVAEAPEEGEEKEGTSEEAPAEEGSPEDGGDDSGTSEEQSPEVDNTPWWERDEPPEHIGDKEWAAIKRNIRRSRDFKQQAEELLAQNNMRKQELEQQQALLESLKDPDKLLEHISKLKGKSVHETYQELTDRMIAQEEGKPMTAAEVEAMVERRLQERLKQEQEAQQRQQGQGVMAMRRKLVDEAMNIPTDPKMAEEFPYLASLDDASLQDTINFALDWGAKNAPDQTLRQILKNVDEYEQKRFNRIAAKRGFRPVAEQETAPSPEKQARKSISNADVVGSTSVDLTAASPEERIKIAASLLPDF